MFHEEMGFETRIALTARLIFDLVKETSRRTGKERSTVLMTPKRGQIRPQKPM